MIESDRLASTAAWTARMRSRENQRPDRLFFDPIAQSVALSNADIGSSRPQGGTHDPSLPVRTLFFDNELERIAYSDGVRQIVLVAAGFDARVFRLTWPACTVIFEIDVDEVFAVKEPAIHALDLRSSCNRRIVPHDLRDEAWVQALIAAGFNPNARTVWLVEGLLYYLTADERDLLLTRLTGVTPGGSWMLLDYIRESAFTTQPSRRWLSEMSRAHAAWRSGCDNPVRWLAAVGWAAEIVEHGTPKANFGRWGAVDPVTRSADPHQRYLVSARRR